MHVGFACFNFCFYANLSYVVASGSDGSCVHMHWPALIKVFFYFFFFLLLLNCFLHFDRIYCDLCECCTVVSMFVSIYFIFIWDFECCVVKLFEILNVVLLSIYLRLWMLCCWIIWDFECCVVEYLFETLNVVLLYVNVVWLSIYLRL